jgi:hypothetical protein
VKRLILIGLSVLVISACDRKRAEQREYDAPSASRSDRIDRFWAWFAREAPRLRGEAGVDAMNAVNAQLEMEGFKVYAEIEPDDAAWLLVITADGDRSLFPEVDEVVARAPVVKGWTVVAYRQRAPVDGMRIEMDGASLEYDEVRVVATRAGDKLDLRLYLPGFKDETDTVFHMGFIALDHTIGEKDMETRIGVIEGFPRTKAPPDAIELAELPALLDSTFAK